MLNIDSLKLCVVGVRMECVVLRFVSHLIFSHLTNILVSHYHDIDMQYYPVFFLSIAPRTCHGLSFQICVFIYLYTFCVYV